MADAPNPPPTAEKDTGRWRPLRRRLNDEALALVAKQTAAGRPVPVHLMLVNDGGPQERGRTACDGGWGEWCTGDIEQVTCHPCLEQVHA